MWDDFLIPHFFICERLVYMSTFFPHTESYNKPPLSVGDNRDENIIIDVLGNWIPECDLIYYGLLNSPHSNEFPKLRDTKIFKPRDIYLDHCFFSGDDLIRYLSTTDNSLAELDDRYLTVATTTALNHYTYVPCNETMFRHSIIELAYFDFVKSITLVYPWDLRKIDLHYLNSIIPYSVLSKFNIVSGNMLDYIKEKTNTKFTTIVCNTIQDVITLIDNPIIYRTNSSFFLLRNSSQTVSYNIENDPNNPSNTKIDFTELGNKEILSRIMDLEHGIPNSQMRFARYEPYLFDDAKPKDNENFYGSQR